MESFDTGGNRSLVSELTDIHEMVKQLHSQFNDPCFSLEFSKSTVSKLLSKTEKSIMLAKTCGLAGVRAEPVSPPRSGSASPCSETSDLAFKCQDNRKEVCKKRKAMPRWRSQVRVGSVGGVEGPLDDGHSWRKYGQKDILGAKYPRGYYRCTHRNSQDCLATKQVQRTDEDPSVFDVIYHGAHTCQPRPGTRVGPNTTNNNNSNNNTNNQDLQSSHDQDLLNSLKATLTVKTEGLGVSGSGQEETHEWNFSFPSTPIGSSHAAPNNYFLGGGFSPSFTTSPATSDSNYFPVSASRLSNYGAVEGAVLGFQTSESDLTEVVSTSAPASVANSPMGDMDFAGLQFDPTFHIDISSLFPTGYDMI